MTTNTSTRRALVAAAVLAIALTGCGGKAKSAAPITTTTVATGAAAGTTATTTPVDTSDPAAVATNVDTSLNDLNSDLSAIDSAPADEGDPTS